MQLFILEWVEFLIHIVNVALFLTTTEQWTRKYMYHWTALAFLGDSMTVEGLKKNNSSLNVSKVIVFVLLITIL
jgi:hypothetical protein